MHLRLRLRRHGEEMKTIAGLLLITLLTISAAGCAKTDRLIGRW